MKSPIKWTGGKAREIKYFEDLIPEFNTYIEPFFGGGAVYWYLQPKNAIVSDINQHLINFYWELRNNYDELIEYLNEMPFSKDYFNDVVIKLNNKEYTNEAEQASLFYYLNKTAFSGKWRVNSKDKYNNSWGNYKRPNYKTLDRKYSDTLQSTLILDKDYKFVMDSVKFDTGAFLFLDPPYLNSDTMYTVSQEFEHIYNYVCEYIRDCKCKVMMVCKGDEYIRELFQDYIHREYDVKYSHNAKSNKNNKHLIITNY